MKVLVTGGAGFIGSNLCQRLLDNGHKVVAVDNLITGRIENVNRLKKNPNFTFIKHDITELFPKNLDSRLLTLDSIYHLACPTGVDNLIPLAQEMILASSIGTKNVLDLAKKTGAELLFTSSSEVYGDPKISPQAESYTGNVDPVGIRSPYEEGKRFSESLISMYVRKYNIDAKIVRVFNTYGPHMSQRDSRVIGAFLRQARSGSPLSVHGRGNQRRTFCFIEDLINGLILVMAKGKKGEVYNLGGSREVKIVDLAHQIINLTKSKSKIKFIDRPPHDHQMRKPELSKIKKLGWRQKINLEKGIVLTAKSMS